MADDVNIVLASNRGPVSFVEDDGSFDLKRGAGGLAGALDPVARRLGDAAVWVAAANSDTDRRALHAGAADGLNELLGYGVYLLDIEPDIYSAYYDDVSNRMLWFANHCLFEEIGIEGFSPEEIAGWDQAYEPVNRLFADAVREVSDGSSLILFQDYHLTTAPGHLRSERPDQAILHFTHSSFCGPRGMRHLPAKIYEELIRGMLGADLLGFHVARWVEGFMSCCEDLGYTVDRRRGTVEHDSRLTWLRAYPIPIDPKSLLKRAQRVKVRRWADRFRGRARSPIIVRADRTEPSKNIVRGFEAYGRLLDRRADLADRALFIACLYPSRQTMDEYREYTRRIEQIVSDINGRHPGAIELFMKDDFDRTLGALEVYDVLLVNPIMDGMNLVAKEGPTLNENNGVVVLSQGAGAYQELGDDAITIDDPLNVDETAAALERAIEATMDDRKMSAEALRAKAGERNAQDWIEAQIDDLVLVRDGREPATPVAPRPT